MKSQRELSTLQQTHFKLFTRPKSSSNFIEIKKIQKDTNRKEMGLAPRQWVYLIIFYTSYLMLGACVFYHIEHNAETERRAKELAARIEIHGRH